MKAFQYLGYQKNSLPISETLSDKIISLPMHPYLEKQDIDKLASIVRSKKDN